MQKLDWFLILKGWKKKMGAVGVTLPFLFAALKLKSDTNKRSPKSAQEIMNEIITGPVDGYVTQVQQCPDISETVLSVVKLKDKSHRVISKCHINSPGKEVESLVLSSDFQSKYGLKGNDLTEYLEKLLEVANDHIQRRILQAEGGAREIRIWRFK